MARNGTNRDERLALALARGLTVAKAAKSSGVSLRTAWRRLADPQFGRRVTELRGEMTAQATARLCGTMSAAAVRLRQLLRSADGRIALGAAKGIFEIGQRMREAVEWEQRLADLERLTQGKKNATSGD